MKKPKRKTYTYQEIKGLSIKQIAFAVFLLWLILVSVKIHQDNKVNEALTQKVIASKIQNDSLQTQNDSLKTQIKELKTFERYGISIGDTTLQVVTKLNIQGEPYKYLHVKRIKKGRNDFYFALNEKTAINLVLMKY